MFFKQKLLFVAMEAVEGQPETIATADAVETRNLSINLYQGDRLTKDVDRLTFGAQESVNANPHTGFSFEVLLAGAGDAGVAPAWGRLLRICGFQEVVDATAGAEVTTYNLASGGYESGHLEMRRPIPEDTTKHQQYLSNGVRGSWSLDLSAKQWPLLKFDNLLGSWVEPAEVAALVADTSAWKDPIPVTKDNTPVIKLGGVDMVMQAFSANSGNNIIRRNLPGEQCTLLTDRSVTGSITVKAPRLTDRNYFADLQSHQGISTLPVEIQHGTQAGGIVKVIMPQVQLSDISETDLDGELAYQFNFSALPTDAGDDEFQLILPHNP